MKTAILNRLSDLILDESAAILKRWTDEVMRVPGARHVDRPALVDHIPELIRELGHTLRKQEEIAIDPSNSSEKSEAHGSLRFKAGFDIVDVVAEYNALREVLYDFADERDVTITGTPAKIINRTIDRAIAFAVKAYAAEKTLELQRRREEHVSFIVHDLKTPLAAIETAMAIIDQKYKVPAGPSGKLLDMVRRNAHRLHALISQVLQQQSNLQTVITSLQRRECDVWPLVEGLVRDCRPLADAARTDLTNEIPEDMCVNADAQALSRVFQNLLSNAIKYTKDGRIVVGGCRMGDHAEFWVADSGDGIAPDRIGRIFDKFETDHLEDGGLGLGLAIVKDIVEAHNGTVAVESTPGKGTKFTFTIA